MTMLILQVLKVPFKQKISTGCGSYSLANLLNDERFIEGTEKLKFGEGIADLNKKLSSIGYPLFLDCVFASPSEMVEQPNKLIDPLVFQILWDKLDNNHKENYARPFLATVKMARFHCIVILHNLKNDFYYVVDSLVEEIQVLTLKELMNRYHFTAVEYVCSWDIQEEDRSVFIRKDLLTHIIPLGD